MGRQPTFIATEESLASFSEAVNSKMNPVIYLSIDPGHYTGICGYDEKCYPQFMYVVASKDVSRFLRCFTKIQKLIYEGYWLFPNKAPQQSYSNMETPRVIGRIEDWAEDHPGVELIKQKPGDKKSGYAFLGKKPPSKASNKNDTSDAHVHFIYWAVKTGKINAIDLLRSTS